jgi:hypothetical protein
MLKNGPVKSYWPVFATLAEALDFNRKEAREAAESNFEEETLSV